MWNLRNFKNTYFEEHLWTAAFALLYGFSKVAVRMLLEQSLFRIFPENVHSRFVFDKAVRSRHTISNNAVKYYFNCLLFWMVHKLTNDKKIIWVFKGKFRLLDPFKDFHFNCSHPKKSKNGSSWLITSVVR